MDSTVLESFENFLEYPEDWMGFIDPKYPIPEPAGRWVHEPSLEQHGSKNTVTIKEVYDRQFDQVKFDRNLCRRIIHYSQQFMTRNEDHSAFFGGVLLGVNPIRFLDSDRERWFEDVLDIDEDLLSSDFKTITAINHDFQVMSDPFNYTSAYVCHRLMQNNHISQALKKEAMTHAFMVLHYRFLTSLLVLRFRTPADPEVARATYASLSGRFDIKRYGSWRALIEARSENLISPNSIYRRVIQEFSPDTSKGEGPSVIRVVTDTQGRIREVVKKIYAIHTQFLKSGTRLRTVTDLSINSDGEMILKDRMGGYSSYIRYVNEVVQTKRNFIRQELVDIIANAMVTMPPKLLVESLEYMTENYQKRNQAYLEDIVKESILYAVEFLSTNRLILSSGNDLSEFITRLRSLLMASRSSDPTVLKLRELTEKMVREAVKSRNQAVIASVRTGVILYITLRTLTKQHYS